MAEYHMFYLKDVETQEKFWVISENAIEAAAKARYICGSDHAYQVMQANNQNIPGFYVLGIF